MTHDPMRVWLLAPGIAGLGILPTLLDETDARGAVEQLGRRWKPIDGAWRLEGSGLWDGSYCHELLGAIHRAELVMLFENSLIAIVQSDRSFAVSRIAFEVIWIELPEDATAEAEYAA